MIELKEIIIITSNAPVKFKRKVGLLLNELMRSYKIKGKNAEFESAFKEILKSNLYYMIDNYYDVKK